MGGFKYGRHYSVNPDAPEPYGICDRCGFICRHKDLSFQRVIQGKQTVKTNLLVCPKCTDKLAEFTRTIRIPPDPVPIKNPRPMSSYGNITGIEYDDGEQYEDGDDYAD